MDEAPGSLSESPMAGLTRRPADSSRSCPIDGARKENWGGSLQSAPRTDPEQAGRRRRSLDGASCRRRPHPAPARRAGPRARHAKAVHLRVLRRSRPQRRTRTSRQKLTSTPPNGGFHTQPSITRPTDRRKRKTPGLPAYCVQNRQRRRHESVRLEPNARSAPRAPLPGEVGGPFSVGCRSWCSRESKFSRPPRPCATRSRRLGSPALRTPFSIPGRRRPRRRRSRRR